MGQFISHAFALLPHVVPDTPGSVRASKRKRAHTAIDAESDKDPIPPTSSTASKRQKPVAKPRPALVTEEVDEDGFLKDISVQDINDEAPRKQREDSSRDIQVFFSEAFETQTSDGKRRRRRCIKCPRKHGDEQPSFVADVSTLRRHVESNHRAAYMDWCAANDFEPKLPKYRAQIREKKAASRQKTLEPHLKEMPTCALPYSDHLYHEAAIHWLVENDLPIQALEHPSF
ncbi:hypothetical protein PTI98_012335 [Pleurotus ostreatus]|nr:hypothetical protein PTI98_012335 [Pleurotus ostreatus]